MDKTVASALLEVAVRRQRQEFTKWIHMAKLAPEQQVEAQRLRVAAWATAASELYDQARQEQRTAKEN